MEDIRVRRRCSRRRWIRAGAFLPGFHAIMTRRAESRLQTKKNALAHRTAHSARRLATLVLPTPAARLSPWSGELAVRCWFVDPTVAARVSGPVPGAGAAPGPDAPQSRRSAGPDAAAGCLDLDPRSTVAMRRPTVGVRPDADSSVDPERSGTPVDPAGHPAPGRSIVRRSRRLSRPGRSRLHHGRPGFASPGFRWIRRTGGPHLGPPLGVPDRRPSAAGLRDFPARLAVGHRRRIIGVAFFMTLPIAP